MKLWFSPFDFRAQRRDPGTTGVSRLFKAIPRGTTGRKATRGLNNAAVQRARAKEILDQTQAL